MSLEQFQTQLKNILRQTGHTQQQLAGELGLHPTLLTNKLLGVRKGRLTNREVKQIVLVLAGWEALYSRQEVGQLLAYMDLPLSLFSLSEWACPPLSLLEESGLPGNFTVSPVGKGLPPKPDQSGYIRGQTVHNKTVSSSGDRLVSNQAAGTGSYPLQLTKEKDLIAGHIEITLPPKKIPQALTRLIGRDEVLREVEGLICQEDVRLVSLAGPGGIGKTRVAQAIAQRLQDQERFKDGVFFVGLDNLNNPVLVPKVICNSLGLPEKKDDTSPLKQLSEFIAGQEILLVLDNFEQLLKAAPTLEHLLLNSPHLKLLVTSRIRLGIYGEWEYIVPPLPLPQLPQPAKKPPFQTSQTDYPEHEPTGKAELEEIRVISQNPAVALFVERARAINYRFKLDSQSVGPVIKLCRLLDGVPLALELAAARIRLFDLADLENLLQQSYLTVLQSEGRMIYQRSERHQSLQACMAWSYSLLKKEEQALFCRLGIFADTFSIETAEAVFPATTSAGRLLLAESIEGLLSQSLLQPLETGLPEQPGEVSEQAGADLTQVKRFRMLEPLREFALEQLRQAAPPTPPEQVEIEVESEAVSQTNVQVETKTYYEVWENYCLYWASWVKKVVEELYGSRVEQAFFRMKQEYANILSALEWGLQNNATSPVLALAAELAFYWIWGTQYNVGTLYLDRVLNMTMPGNGKPAVLSQSDKELSLLGKVLYGAGFIAVNKIDFPKAEDLLQQSLAIFRKLQDKVWLIRVLGGLAFRATSQGQFKLSRQYLDEGLVLSREVGDESRLAASLNNLGVVAIHLKDDEAALAYSKECLNLVRKHHNKVGQAMSLNLLGYIMVNRAENREAQEFLEESLEIAGKIGHRESLSLTRNVLALNYYYQADFRSARFHLNEGLRIAFEMGDKFSALYNLSAQPMVNLKLQTYPAENLKQNPQNVSADAAKLPEQTALLKAARLLGATAALTRQTNGFAFPRFRELFDEGFKVTRESLDAATFEAAWKSGEQMSLEETINFALQD